MKLLWRLSPYVFCRIMTFVSYDVCRIMTFVSYDVCRIMTFVNFDVCRIMKFVASEYLSLLLIGFVAVPWNLINKKMPFLFYNFSMRRLICKTFFALIIDQCKNQFFNLVSEKAEQKCLQVERKAT